jgi:hypothetical protein
MKIETGMQIKGKRGDLYVRSVGKKFVTLYEQRSLRDWRWTIADVLKYATALDGSKLEAPDPKVEKTPTEPAGTCGSCFNVQQTRSGGKLVDHGYTIPRGWHMRNGRCAGVNYLAFELSTEATEITRDAVRCYAGTQEEMTLKLKAGKIVELLDRRDARRAQREKRAQRTLTPADGYAWQMALNAAIHKAEYEAEQARKFEKELTKKIDAWTLQPLRAHKQ